MELAIDQVKRVHRGARVQLGLLPAFALQLRRPTERDDVCAQLRVGVARAHFVSDGRRRSACVFANLSVMRAVAGGLRRWLPCIEYASQSSTLRGLGCSRSLGTLREVGRELRRDGLIIDELPRDLVKLTPPQVRERLASYSLLPPSPPRVGLRQMLRPRA